MVEVVHWLNTERLAIIIEGGPFILLGLAWLALQPTRCLRLMSATPERAR